MDPFVSLINSISPTSNASNQTSKCGTFTFLDGCLSTAPTNAECPSDTFGIGSQKKKKMKSCSVYTSELGKPGSPCTSCFNIRGSGAYDRVEVTDSVNKYCKVVNTTQTPNSDCLCVSNTLDPVLNALVENNIGNAQIKSLLDQKLIWYLPCKVPNYLITPELIDVGTSPNSDTKAQLCSALNMKTQTLLSDGIITQSQLNDFKSRTICLPSNKPPSGSGGTGSGGIGSGGTGSGGQQQPPPKKSNFNSVDILIGVTVFIVVIGLVLFFISRAKSK